MEMPDMKKMHASPGIHWGSLEFWKTDVWKGIQDKLRKNDVVPNKGLIFRPLIETPISRTKVVFLGAEPLSYAEKGSLDGLAYSFNHEIKKLGHAPASLQSIIYEAMDDQDILEPSTGSLKFWARQGVLLWNCVPTTIKGVPGACSGWGWETLTQEILETVYLANPDTVFVFLDKRTRFYQDVLPDDALVLQTPPVTNYSEFKGCQVYTQINDLLRDTGQRPIDWRIK